MTLSFAERAPWWVAGPLIGLCVVGLMWAANKPLGALGGFSAVHQWATRRRGEAPGWRVFFLAGMVLGGALSALAAGGGWHATAAYGSLDVLVRGSLPLKGAVLLAGGAVMGYGARLAGGCTSGHGVCGTSLGSPASFVATGTFMATAIVAANVLGWALGVPR